MRYQICNSKLLEEHFFNFKSSGAERETKIIKITSNDSTLIFIIFTVSFEHDNAEAKSLT